VLALDLIQALDDRRLESGEISSYRQGRTSSFTNFHVRPTRPRFGGSPMAPFVGPASPARPPALPQGGMTCDLLAAISSGPDGLRN
jgi:hypothetical protein